MSRSASAPATSNCDCLANSGKKRSSFGIKARNQASILKSPSGAAAARSARQLGLNDVQARSVPRRAPAAARSFALFLLAEAGGQKVRHRVEAGSGVRALG